MTDIAMCKGKDCKRKTECYRHMVKPNPYRQSYMEPVAKDCEFFINLETK